MRSVLFCCLLLQMSAHRCKYVIVAVILQGRCCRQKNLCITTPIYIAYMGINHTSFRKFETADRVVINFLSVRGTGITGKWLLEMLAESACEKSRYLIEFMPKRMKHTRLGMLAGGAMAAPECAEALRVPDATKTAFAAWVGEQCYLRGVSMRRTRQGPGWMLDQLGNLLLNQDIAPSDETLAEVEGYIRWHLTNPHAIRPVAGNVKQFYFGDEETGRFFMTETPPRG